MTRSPHEIIETMQKEMILRIPEQLREEIEREAQIRFQRRLYRRLRKDPRWDENILYPLVSSASVHAFDK